jgi:hypothetical protein
VLLDVGPHVLRVADVLEEADELQQLGVRVVVVPALDGDAVLRVVGVRVGRVIHQNGLPVRTANNTNNSSTSNRPDSQSNIKERKKEKLGTILIRSRTAHNKKIIAQNSYFVVCYTSMYSIFYYLLHVAA